MRLQLLLVPDELGLRHPAIMADPVDFDRALAASTLRSSNNRSAACATSALIWSPRESTMILVETLSCSISVRILVASATQPVAAAAAGASEAAAAAEEFVMAASAELCAMAAGAMDVSSSYPGYRRTTRALRPPRVRC